MGIWGVARRVAVVAIAACGSVPFVSYAFPAVVTDEFLSWAATFLVDFISRSAGKEMPTSIGLVWLPLLSQVHFLPAVVKVFLLGWTVYLGEGYYSTVDPVVMAACVFAWTLHN